MSTVTVKHADGTQTEVSMYTADQITAMQTTQKSPQNRKALVDHMKALGMSTPEIMRRSEDENKEAILAKYVELGGKPNGKAKAAPAAAAKAPAAAPKAAAKAAAPKAAAPKAAAPAEDDDDDDGAIPGAASEPAAIEATGVSAELVEALRAEVAELKAGQDLALETVNELKASFEEVTAKLNDVFKYALDTHFIVRTTGPTSAGLSNNDVEECSELYYGKLMLEPAEGNA